MIASQLGERYEVAKQKPLCAEPEPKGVMERDVETKIPDTSAEVILYCGGGFRSALAADNLQKMGYANVISMDGGWRDWTGSGYPTEM